jgi:tRNA A-37 threonylcarbamoyl transferase component Bud32
MADPIDRVASAVSNGEAVDWVREKSRRPHLIEALDQLDILERIRKTHESAHPDDGSTEDFVEPTPRTETLRPDERPEPLFRWGRLEVVELVGEGGGGTVYRALDTALNAEVALKLLRADYVDSPQLVERFLEEARRLARVRHPNVLLVHGADQFDGRVGLWTEFIRGKSLEEVITEQGAMSACEAALVGLEICKALAAMHAVGLIHRDVKTTNVMRADGGRIVLMDFGSVAETHGEGGAWTAGFQGTPIAMAPEQLRGRVAGAATDLYGLGVLLYRLVTRRYPLEAASLADLREKQQRGEQVLLRDRRADLPLEFVQIVERAMRLEPSERYASAGEMEQELAVTLGSLARKEAKRRRAQGFALGTVAAAAVVAGVLIGGTMFRQPPPVPPEPSAKIAVPPLPAPLKAEAKLMRRSGEEEAPLDPGSRIKPDDRLSLLITGTDSMHVYVLNEDAAGEVFGLFPVPGLQPENPLRAHMEHRLPGDLGKQTYYWNVTSSVGKERIVAIASRRPLLELQAAMERIPRVTKGRPPQFGRVDPMALRNLRGLGSGTPMEPPSGEAKRRLDAAVAALEEEARLTGDVWVWTIDLMNPPAEP